MNKVPKPEHGSEAWLLLRQRDEHGHIRFGASEAPTLMGVNKWATLTDLALSKWSAPEVQPPNAAMMRGNLLEPALIEYACTVLNERIVTPSEMFVNGRLIATLDGLNDDATIIVEAKTTTAHSCDDPLPLEYLWQVCAQFACVPTAREAVVVVLDKRMRLGHWRVLRNENLIAQLMVRADEIGEYLDRRELPPDAPLDEKSTKALYPSPDGEVELDAVTLDALQRWQHWSAIREDAETREQAARDEVAAALGRAEAGTVGGKRVVTFKKREGARRVDMVALRAAHPELVQQFMVVGGSTRILRICS